MTHSAGEPTAVGSSPLFADHAGYADIAAPDIGEWEHMLTPGTSGFGVMPTLIYPGGGCQCMGVLGDYEGTVMVPSIVRWKSALRDDGFVADEIAIEYVWEREEYWGGRNHPVRFDFPPVIVADLWSVDEYTTAQTNLLVHPDQAWGDWMEIDGIGQVHGLAMPWQITPIDKPTWISVSSDAESRWSAWDTHLFHYCLCNSEALTESWGDDEDETQDYDHTGFDENGKVLPSACYYEFGDVSCSCGKSPTAYQVWEALVADRNPTWCGHCYIPHHEELWQYALNRYFAGWEHMFWLEKQGVTWASSLLQQRYPFSASPLRNLQRLHGCVSGTTSQMSQESPPEYSQLSMQFAS